MPDPPESLFDRIAERRREPAPLAMPGDAHVPGHIGARLIVGAVGLSLAAVLAPAAVAVGAALNPSAIPPLAASALVALLVLAPAALCVVVASCGWRAAAERAAAAADEAELAVLRVAVDAALFGYAAAIAVECVPIAAAALVAAWAMLLLVVQWPAVPPTRRHAAMALDAMLFSAFLHFGGGMVAGGYPFYLLMIFYAGLRFGLDALIASAVAAVAGFAAVVLSTAFWQAQPALAGGLLVALAVVPACFAATVQALAAARATASGAEAERRTTLRLIAETLRTASPAANSGQLAVNEISDFAALEAGTFAAPVETFDLRALLRHSLMPLRAKALERGTVLRWRIDPRVPDRLRGQAQALGRIVAGLSEYALSAAPGDAVRLAVDGASLGAQRLRLTLRVEGLAAGGAPGSVTERALLSLRLVERLIKMAAGSYSVERAAGDHRSLIVSLPLAIEAGSSRPPLDLARRAVVIASEDDELAGQLAEALAIWGAEPRWLRDPGVARDELATHTVLRPVLLVDGRDKLLSALSLVHGIAASDDTGPFVILIAQPAQVAALGGIEEAGIDAVIPAPVSEALLANALDGLPLLGALGDRPERPAPRRAATLPVDAPLPPAEPAAERITPIAAHPRFAPDASPSVDPRVIDGLRALGGGPGFLAELVETFGADARQILQRIEAAAAAADTVGFARGIVALQRAAGQLGGSQLCEVLAAMQHLGANELRQRGISYVRRLDAEIERFIAALLDCLEPGSARQG